MTKRVSTIEYLSNLQPVVGKIKEDKEFLSNIHDPFSLAIMNDWINSKKLKYNFTKLQEEEYKNASVHCTYAFKDDYPWGTINDKNNNKIVICKCTNTSCVHFRKCRKDNVKINEVINILDNNDIQDSKLESYIREGDNFIQSIKKNVVSVKDEDKNISGSKLNFNKDINDETSDLSKMVNKTDASKEYQFQKDNIIKSIGFEDFSVVNQEDVINSRLNERIIVNAGPGTGKTWTLINKLIHLINVENIDPDEILVLCFSRAAVNVIQKRLEEAYKNEEIGLEWQLIDIRTFDSFATYLLAYCKNEDNNFKYEFEKLDYDSRIKLADEILKKRNELIEQCAYLIVDEVQDLVSSRDRKSVV